MQSSGEQPISRALARRLLPLAIGIGLTIALLLPGLYAGLEYKRLKKEAASYAKQLTVVLKDMAAMSPKLWKFNATKYSQSLETFLPFKNIVAIVVMDERGQPITQLNYTETNPDSFLKIDETKNRSIRVQGEPAPIFFNNQVIGTVHVYVAAGLPLVVILMAFSLCAVVGFLCGRAIYHLPLEVVSTLENQLLAYQSTLEQLVEDRTEKLRESTEKAESANRAKSLFLANMSHEIRTPMNAIIGMTHLAMQTKIDNQRQRFLETVHHSAESLLNLLNDILDFSKMEAGQLQLHTVTFHLERLLKDIVSTMSQFAEEKGLQLTVTIDTNLPLLLIGDDLRLRQVLLNLVSNAIKFTIKGAVHIKATGTVEGNQAQVHIAVSDTGIGIPPEKCEQIFNSFEQADSSHARRFGGTGLGLSICSQLIHLMNGQIWVESKEGEGATFHFTLTLPVGSQEVEEALPGIVEEQMGRAGLRILVVDDNEVNRDVATMLLEGDHSVVAASNGFEALGLLATQVFDVILMDVQMPEMDGLSATRVIRRLEQGLPLTEPLPDELDRHLAERLRGGHMHIVAMTAHAMGEDREMCLAAGMDGYLTKPFQPALLMEALSSLASVAGREVRVMSPPTNSVR